MIDYLQACVRQIYIERDRKRQIKGREEDNDVKWQEIDLFDLLLSLWKNSID